MHIHRAARRAAALLLAGACTLAPPAQARPTGAVTARSGATITGWACDPDAPEVPIAVDVYADGIGTRGLPPVPMPSWARYKGLNLYADHHAGEALATQPNAQQSPACGSGAHGFSFTVPQAFRSQLGPGTHQLHLFLRPTVGEGEHPEMPGPPVPLVVTGRQTPVDDWYNGLRHACRSWKDKSWQQPPPATPDPGPSYRFLLPADRCASDYPGGFEIARDRFWVLESTNETKDFAPVYDARDAAIDFPPNVALRKGGVPVWKLETTKSPRGGYTVTHVLDKRRGRAAGTPLDSYSAAALQTELGAQAPELGTNAVFLELWWRVTQAEGAPILPSDASGGLTREPYAALAAQGLLPARMRFMVGMHISAAGTPLRRNLEVNLFKAVPDPARPGSLAAFDLCTTTTLVEGLQPPLPCEQAGRNGPDYADDVGLFDRRSVANPIVYFDIATLHRVAGLPQPSGSQAGFQRVLIPVSGLVRNAPWLDRPGLVAALPLAGGIADLRGLRLASFYIASEIWGKARLAVEFERLNIFTFVAD